MKNVFKIGYENKLLEMFCNRVLPFFILLFLCHCTHLNNKSCLDINWYELGRQDSSKGISLEESLKNKRKSCLKFDLAITRAYTNGFDSGLREYCTLRGGYNYGISKTKNASKACPKHLRKNFDLGYKIGLYIDRLEIFQRNLNSHFDELDSKMKNQKLPLSQSLK